ncbi:hypothetical protein [Foetidibacter luteolus]|uniref:hypothetical protein n=1 Tax=Foetidibacter luteolus TaxID=2608880 RepID=UPI00129AD59D|nr:hypothetical protein [Foetidibacter luteolus]
MSCCNKKRTTFTQPAAAQVQQQPAPAHFHGHTIQFQYTGRTALSAVGNITGKRYHFYRPGDIQSVDYRDAAGMETVPVLKKL